MTRWKLYVFLSSALALASCSPSTCPTIAVHQWSQAEQRQAAAEISQLPDDSILPAFIEDYARIRREVQ